MREKSYLSKHVRCTNTISSIPSTMILFFKLIYIKLKLIEPSVGCKKEKYIFLGVGRIDFEVYVQKA